ncbi:MAG: S41 family peptidase [Bacteroidota bacterium]|nr:S41 family peptidase [Bacteroidota bacterium]
MKKKSLCYLAAIFICVSCNIARKASYDPNQKYSSKQLTEDFIILQKVLKSNHPGLYWYATKDSVDGYFSEMLSSLKDSLTEHQFRNKVSWVIDKIHCGHTTVRSSQRYSRYYSTHKTPLFPLSLKVWRDTAVVVANARRNDSTIKRGTLITSINNFSTTQILDSICMLIGTDGYSSNFKYQLISFNFPGYYRNAFGSDSVFLLKYLDSLGKQKEIKLRSFEAKADTNRQRERLPLEGIKKQRRIQQLLNSRSLQLDSSLHTAFLSVNTFSEGKLNRFFRKSFKQIKQKHMQNVVLDLRLNSGGSVLSSTKLTQYLIKQPFRVADTVAAYTRDFPYKKYIKPWFIYWLSMHISGRKYDDGRIHFRYFENHRFKPKKRNHFDGKLYVLTGGYTFSAAALVAGKLKGQNNVTIVGEETGGGAYGNSAMFLPTIVLPETGLRVTLPLYRMVLNAQLPKDGHGVLPDVEVNAAVAPIKMGIDAKMEKVKKLIKRNNASLGTIQLH